MSWKRPPNVSDKLADWRALADAGGEQLLAGKIVAEVGPGAGVDALLFAEKANVYVVLDIDLEVLDRVRHVAPQASLFEHDAREPWPFPDGTFDVVLDFSSFDDTGDAAACYAHAARALRQGGTLVTSYANARVIGEAPADATFRAIAPDDLVMVLLRQNLEVRLRRNETEARSIMVATKMKERPVVTLERTRGAWCRAAAYPDNKETVYPEHATIQEFDKWKGATVLEYGCGGGADAMSYLRRGCHVTYVDIVPGNVEAAEKRIREAELCQLSVGLVLEESDRIPVPSGTFDLANAHGVLHHIVEPRLALHEIKRVLKPGGTLFAMLYTESLYLKHEEKVRELMRDHGIGPEEAFGWCTDDVGTPWARAYSGPEGEKLLHTSGFKLKEVREYSSGEFRTFIAVAE